MTIHQDMTIVPVDELKPHPKNARRGNVSVIAESLKAHGQFHPIVANRRNSTIIAGHHLWRAAKSLGWPEVSVLWVDVTEARHRRMMVVDNRSSDLGEYDMEALEALLTEIGEEGAGLSGTGFNEADISRMFGRQVTEYKKDPDETPDLEGAPTRCTEGDIWLLGPHRLAVGDATSPEVLQRLMDGEQADVMWTDPPYGVEYVGKTSEALTIQNDGAEGLEALLLHAFEAAKQALRPGAPIYVAHADTERMTFEGALREVGYIVRQNLIWVKNSLVLGRSDYQYRHEPILEGQAPPDEEIVDHEPIMYGFTPGGQGRLGRGGGALVW